MTNAPYPRDEQPRVTVWRKATRSQSNTGQCVEVAAMGSVIAVRDSKVSTGQFPYLTMYPNAWRALTESIKAN